MKKRIAAPLALAAALVCTFSAVGCGTSAKAFGKAYAELRVRRLPEDDGTAISDELFGVFLEDINYASYALDDNLIANGSFESTESTARWRTSAQLDIATTGGISEAAPKYAVLKTEAGTTLSNDGYEFLPIAVNKGGQYEFSAFLRADDYEGNVTVSVTDSKSVYAEKTFSVAKSDEWVKYVVSMEGTGTAEKDLSLRLTFGTAGTVRLDGVQFITKEATCGIKSYAFNAIRDLEPKFVRFPGGCVIEGRTMENTYDWKNSIGAVAKDGDDLVPTISYKENRDGAITEKTTRGEEVTRKPNTDLWKGTSYYTMEYGVGFYEYFMLCEAIGAQPIPILNCGMSCLIQTKPGTPGVYNDLEGRHGDYIDDYIWDALDLVCFANGSTTSSDPNEQYWAQVRTDMGHPEPFNVKYIGIGNEQWGERYFASYEYFLSYFKGAAEENPLYGKVQLIVGNGPTFDDCEGNGSGTARSAAVDYRNEGKITNLSEYGIVDEHYYMNYVDFFTNTDFYDRYLSSVSTPDGYSVFLGEYSANSAVSRYDGEFPFIHNSWITALSEAAYMTGIERNGNVVKFASYAPMFGIYTEPDASNDPNQWAADMMYVTNTKLVKTPNYYVQQLFSVNSGTIAPRADLILSDELDRADTKEILTNVSGSEVEIDKLYCSVVYDKASGELIVKVVNASGEKLKLNVVLPDEANVASKGMATVLKADSTEAVNTLEQESVKPETVKLTGIGKTFGYAADKYSVSAIRVKLL